MTGLHEEIQLSVMVVGHTRCLVDGCFGLIKQNIDTLIDTLVQLQDVVEDSASVNTVQLYQAPRSSRAEFINGMTGCPFLMNGLHLFVESARSSIFDLARNLLAVCLLRTLQLQKKEKSIFSALHTFQFVKRYFLV